jgi:hypothetical protein
VNNDQTITITDLVSKNGTTYTWCRAQEQ